MISTTHEGITFYAFETVSDDPGVAFAFTGRHGGVSAPPYDSLNLSLNVPDDREAVAENRRRVAGVVGHPVESWVAAQQVHGSGVAAVGRADCGRGAFDYADGLPDVDALVTDEPGVTLTITVADCVPILLYDPGNHAVGLAHAGWNGTVQHVARRTVETMTELFGTDPAAVFGGIGPSIGPDSYEVGPEVADRAASEYPGTPVVNERDGRLFFDLWRANAADLQSAGLPWSRIETAGVDTFAGEELFSHRRQGPTGRSMALAALPPR